MEINRNIKEESGEIVISYLLNDKELDALGELNSKDSLVFNLHSSPEDSFDSDYWYAGVNTNVSFYTLEELAKHGFANKIKSRYGNKTFFKITDMGKQIIGV